jgi:hypothetical protein
MEIFLIAMTCVIVAYFLIALVFRRFWSLKEDPTELLKYLEDADGKQVDELIDQLEGKEVK